jgi:hypothetical protein
MKNCETCKRPISPGKYAINFGRDRAFDCLACLRDYLVLRVTEAGREITEFPLTWLDIWGVPSWDQLNRGSFVTDSRGKVASIVAYDADSKRHSAHCSSCGLPHHIIEGKYRVAKVDSHTILHPDCCLPGGASNVDLTFAVVQVFKALNIDFDLVFDFISVDKVV